MLCSVFGFPKFALVQMTCFLFFGKVFSKYLEMYLNTLLNFCIFNLVVSQKIILYLYLNTL